MDKRQKALQSLKERLEKAIAANDVERTDRSKPKTQLEHQYLTGKDIGLTMAITYVILEMQKEE